MVVCSFAGHKEVYDIDLVSRMQTEVDKLVKMHDFVKFLVYPYGMYSYVFLLAALKARTKFPEKVAIIFVSYHSEVCEMTKLEVMYSCVSDQAIALNMLNTKKEDSTIECKRLLRWVVQKSTHLITYFYDTLYDAGNHLMKNPKSQVVISLTTCETEKAILEAATYMTEKEQLVFQKMREGHTLRETGNSFGIGGERVRQILQHGCRTIRAELDRRYRRALTAKEPCAPHTCGLFALGPATYESLTRFKHIMELLTSAYNACDIYVEKSCIFSGFLFVLTDSTCLPYTEHQRIHITALLGSDDLPENAYDPDAIKDAFCPPCHAIGHVSRTDSGDYGMDFDVITDMIDRLDFCLCDLSSTPLANKIREYATRTRQTVLLDVSGHNAWVGGIIS